MGFNDQNDIDAEHDLKKDGEARKISASGPSEISVAAVGRERIGNALPPHESYEGLHRWDPDATWTPEEEARVVRKTDFYLLSWICFMVIDCLKSAFLETC